MTVFLSLSLSVSLSLSHHIIGMSLCLSVSCSLILDWFKTTKSRCCFCCCCCCFFSCYPTEIRKDCRHGVIPSSFHYRGSCWPVFRKRNESHLFPLSLSLSLSLSLWRKHFQTIRYTAQKMKFSIKDFFSKCDQIYMTTFTEETFNGKLHFLCSVNLWISIISHWKRGVKKWRKTFLLYWKERLEFHCSG